MQTRRSRDEKAVVIATGLGVFGLVAVVGGLALWALHSLLGLNDSTTGLLVDGLLISAGVALVIYIARSGRR